MGSSMSFSTSSAQSWRLLNYQRGILSKSEAMIYLAIFDIFLSWTVVVKLMVVSSVGDFWIWIWFGVANLKAYLIHFIIFRISQ